MNQQYFAPSLRPNIQLVRETRQPSGIEQRAAVCMVPGCSWRYANVVISDVNEQKRRHADQHRARVPEHQVEDHDAACSCGWARTLPTKAGARREMRKHLTDTHGVVE